MEKVLNIRDRLAISIVEAGALRSVPALQGVLHDRAHPPPPARGGDSAGGVVVATPKERCPERMNLVTATSDQITPPCWDGAI